MFLYRGFGPLWLGRAGVPQGGPAPAPEPARRGGGRKRDRSDLYSDEEAPRKAKTPFERSLGTRYEAPLVYRADPALQTSPVPSIPFAKPLLTKAILRELRGPEKPVIQSAAPLPKLVAKLHEEILEDELPIEVIMLALM